MLCVKACKLLCTKEEGTYSGAHMHTCISQAHLLTLTHVHAHTRTSTHVHAHTQAPTACVREREAPKGDYEDAWPA